MITPQLLTREQDVADLVEHSRRRPTFVFKHSLTCPISSSAWHRYLQFLNEEERAREQADFMAVEIQRARPVSDDLAQTFEVRHESPQALLVADGRVVWHASHGDITEESLGAALDELAE